MISNIVEKLKNAGITEELVKELEFIGGGICVGGSQFGESGRLKARVRVHFWLVRSRFRKLILPVWQRIEQY
jgi:hypothetical protein